MEKRSPRLVGRQTDEYGDAAHLSAHPVRLRLRRVVQAAEVERTVDREVGKLRRQGGTAPRGLTGRVRDGDRDVAARLLARGKGENVRRRVDAPEPEVERSDPGVGREEEGDLAGRGGLREEGGLDGPAQRTEIETALRLVESLDAVGTGGFHGVGGVAGVSEQPYRLLLRRRFKRRRFSLGFS